MAFKEWSFMGVGIPHFALYDASGTLVDGITEALRDAGNATELNLSVETEEKSVPNKRNCGGGKVNSLTRITSVKGSITLTDFTAENLALAFLGDVDAVASGPITDESHASWGEGAIPFTYLPDTDVAYVITNIGNTVTYVKGTDYEERHSGIFVLAGSAMPSDGTGVLCDYTKIGSEVVNAITDSSKKFRVFIEGLNEMQSCVPFDVDMFKVSFAPSAGLDLITDDPGVLTLSFEVLADANKGSGESAYFTMTKRA